MTTTTRQDRDWAVGIVAETTEGEVVLRMTTEQADRLHESLTWLLEDDGGDDERG